MGSPHLELRVRVLLIPANLMNMSASDPNPYAPPLAQSGCPRAERPLPPEFMDIAPESGPGSPLRRLAVTLAAILAVVLLSRLQIPLFAHGQNSVLDKSHSLFQWGLPFLRVGIIPIFAAYLLVEIAALIWRPWRPLRLNGFTGRKQLARATFNLTMILATLQALNWARIAQHFRQADPGAANFFMTASPLIAGTLSLLGLARAVDRWGLGQGFSVVFGGLLLSDALFFFGKASFATPNRLVVLIAAFVTIPLLATWRRHPEGQPGQIPLPSCGLFPLTLPLLLNGLILAFLALARTVPSRTLLNLFREPSALWLALVVVLTVAFTLLFNAPSRVSRPYERLGRDIPHLDIWRLIWSGAARSLALILVLLLLDWFLIRERDPFRVLAIIPGVFMGMDLIQEWRFRLAQPALAAVWPLHQVHAVVPSLQALEAASIPAFPSGLHHRSLLHFFGPAIPIQILVPQAQSEEAYRILHPLLAPIIPEDAQA